MQYRLASAVLFVITLALLGQKAARAEDEIRIGIVLPLSGELAQVGAVCRDAARMALADSASYAKKKYSLKFEDDKLTPGEVAKAAQKLISLDKVSGIVSTWSYGGSVVAPVAERSKIPHIGVAWDATIAKGDYNFLHLTPPSEFMTRFLAAFKKIGVTRVALLGIQESGSVFALDEFKRLAPQFGVEVTYRDEIPWTTTDFTPFITRITASKPEYLLFNMGGSLAEKLLTDLKNLRAPFNVTAITSFDVLPDVRLAEGRWYVSDSYLDPKFAERFQAAYGHSITYGIGNFYEAVRLLIEAFESAPHSKPEEAAKLLFQANGTSPIFGHTTVDPHGIFSYPAQYLRISQGRRIPISLEQIEE